MKYLGNPQSGSQANTTASHNSSGQYLRNRRKPVNPNTGKQSLVRSRLGDMAKRWKTLTDAQRAGWKTLATGQSRVDSLGQTIHLSGFQTYISVNSKRLAFGDVVTDDAITVPALDTLTSVGLLPTAGHMNVSFTASGSLTGQKLGIFASPQRSAGVSYQSDLRLLQVTAAAPVSPIDITANYSARFGALISGDRVFVSVENYNGGFVNPGVVATAVNT